MLESVSKETQMTQGGLGKGTQLPAGSVAESVYCLLGPYLPSRIWDFLCLLTNAVFPPVDLNLFAFLYAR